MSLQNASLKVTEFIINSFDTTKSPVLIGVVILIGFVVAIIANILNIFIIAYDKKLHKPMYLLIGNLAVVDILYTSSTSPTIISVLVAGVKTISYVPCLIQMSVFHLAGLMEMFALAVMAFDRLIAVSCPLHYHRYLTNARTLFLTYVMWIIACCFVAVFPATVIPLPHCSSVLKYSFCHYAAIIRTTCVDPNYFFDLTASMTFSFLFLTFGFICFSYFGIIYFAKLSSNDDKKKIGSTCLSHLIVVTCYYVPVFIISILTRLGLTLTVEARNGLNIGTLLGPSLVNPFVYCLRTKEIKSEIIKIFRNVQISP